MIQMNLQNRLSDVENEHVVYQVEKRRGGINWEIGIDIYTLLYIKQITRTYCMAQGTLLNTL